ncbi:RNA polymerase sigma factor [Fulvivirga sp. M361]|uniref:RNA polymerase sigma factor n=1 Tax=Fulvivirga sp. M361 TaxID=2594266 RepID=UPI00117B0C99|nr:RNA polymerase sigma factor [Fulvivirga sp. M361]TRX53699.1 RNA polymerase sigma factor [Fulvivirga sp. M361]
MSYSIDPYEAELADRCLTHDRVAQKLLYDRYKDAMYTILLRMLNNEYDAADALQEAFIRIFRSLKGFKKESSLGAWIKTIVIRAGLEKQKKHLIFEEINEERQALEPIIWDSDLTGEYLEKAIAQLPNGYKNVFLLIEVEGYTHREVAELVGISEGTSKSQLYYAKKSLQKTLASMMD